jgi:hypothetical protein
MVTTRQPPSVNIRATSRAIKNDPVTFVSSTSGKPPDGLCCGSVSGQKTQCGDVCFPHINGWALALPVGAGALAWSYG